MNINNCIADISTFETLQANQNASFAAQSSGNAQPMTQMSVFNTTSVFNANNVLEAVVVLDSGNPVVYFREPLWTDRPGSLRYDSERSGGPVRDGQVRGKLPETPEEKEAADAYFDKWAEEAMSSYPPPSGWVQGDFEIKRVEHFPEVNTPREWPKSESAT